MIRVLPVRCLKDNYAYIVYEAIRNECLLVDPVEPKLVLEGLKTLCPSSPCTVNAILTTHHHSDHSAGNEELRMLFPYPIPVFGGDSRIPALTDHLFEGASYPFPADFNSLVNPREITIGSFKVLPLFTPGHTKGSVCYMVSDGRRRHLFTGDTLFLSGCGRFFDGCSPEEMLYSLRLLRSLSSLPDPEQTYIYVGHEYALQNVTFSLTLDPSNVLLQKWLDRIKGTSHYTSVPGTLLNELKCNPFLRVEYLSIDNFSLPEFQNLMGEKDPLSLLIKLRELKDAFNLKL